jgi:catechol 2,3-dioxygenase-like lactoylglutathione lyase family enzyme
LQRAAGRDDVACMGDPVTAPGRDAIDSALRPISAASPAAISSISPFFIVRDLERSLAFYRDQLGFEVTHLVPPSDPFFAVVRRGGAQLMVKVTEEHVDPLPNKRQHPWARWDAYLDVPDPDALAAELAARGARFRVPLSNTQDGLRGFEIEDPDGYALFFGRIA